MEIKEDDYNKYDIKKILDYKEENNKNYYLIK